MVCSHPLKEFDEFAVVRAEILGAILRASNLTRLGGKIAMREHAPDGETQPVQQSET